MAGRLVLLPCLSFLIIATHQMQSSQKQTLLQLRQQLHYPRGLQILRNRSLDFCNISTSIHLSVSCENQTLAHLKIVGDRIASLPHSFSMDSFATTLSRLGGSLRSLSLVSLGMWGKLPDKIHRLRCLESLDLGSNFFFSEIPPIIISSTRALRNLTLDDNLFNGTIPTISSNLAFLSLRNNSISGELPDLSSLSSLYLLDLSHNSFSGAIPETYSKLTQLRHLDLSFNSLLGTPPKMIFRLPNIRYLNLSQNLLSGSLTDLTICGSNLRFVDISDNRLTGVVPPCLSTKTAKFQGNCLTKSMENQHKESYCVKSLLKKKRRQKIQNLGILIGVLGGIFGVALVLGYGFLLTCRKYCPRGASEQHLLQKAVQGNSASRLSIELLTNSRGSISEASTMIDTKALPKSRTFSIEELKEATQNFDQSTHIGEGSHGKLYKGILENGTQVVIRCLPSLKKYSIRNLKLRLDLLEKLRHPHLVCLLGYCTDVSGQVDTVRVLLVYEYAFYGNFRTLLAEKDPEKVLKWSERLEILIGVAKALQFLHTRIVPGFSSNQLKINNILLHENQIAKLSDYGLSIIMAGSNKDKVEAEGSFKSWPTENLEDDVYRFGLILLESIGGSSDYTTRKASLLNEMSSPRSSQDERRPIVDPFVLRTSSKDSLSTVITIANTCISPSSSPPSFDDVLWNLQYAAQLQMAMTDADSSY